jgi:hypothetical protein
VPLFAPAGANFEHMPQQQHGLTSGPEASLSQQGRCFSSEGQHMQHFWQAQAKRGVEAKTVAIAVTQTSKDRSALRNRRIMEPV